MRDKHRRKLQNEANKKIKLMNQRIEDDDLWLGRFYIHQKNVRYEQYEDGSGGVLCLVLNFIDKKTGQTVAKFAHYGDGLKMFFEYDLCNMMNDFIIEDCRVWKQENPYKDEKIDYRKERK